MSLVLRPQHASDGLDSPRYSATVYTHSNHCNSLPQSLPSTPFLDLKLHGSVHKQDSRKKRDAREQNHMNHMTVNYSIHLYPLSLVQPRSQRHSRPCFLPAKVVNRCMQLVDVVAAEVAAGFDCLDHEWVPKREGHSRPQMPAGKRMRKRPSRAGWWQDSGLNQRMARLF